MEEETKVEGQEATQTDLSALSPEELLVFAEKANKKANDQEKARIKLEKKLKEVKAEKTPEQDDNKTTAPAVEPTPQAASITLEEARLATRFTNSELDQAKKYAAAFGIGLEEATQSVGFKAQIQAQREVERSKEVTIDDIGSLNASMPDGEFLKAFEAGQLDGEDPSIRARALKLVTEKIEKTKM